MIPRVFRRAPLEIRFSASFSFVPLVPTCNNVKEKNKNSPRFFPRRILKEGERLISAPAERRVFRRRTDAVTFAFRQRCGRARNTGMTISPRDHTRRKGRRENVKMRRARREDGDDKEREKERIPLARAVART